MIKTGDIFIPNMRSLLTSLEFELMDDANHTPRIDRLSELLNSLTENLTSLEGAIINEIDNTDWGATAFHKLSPDQADKLPVQL